MKLRGWMTLHAFVAAAFAVGFLPAPAPLAALFGVRLDAAGLLMARLFATTHLEIAAVIWLARDAPLPLRREIGAGSGGAIAVGVLVALAAQLGGVMNALGWPMIALLLAIALGYGYFALTSTDR
jgi:hypothetical protein